MLEQYTRINQAAGISLMIAQDGSYQINCCSLVAEGNQLDIEQKLTQVSSLEELKKKLPAKLPIALNLSGKGVLVKQVEKQEEITATNFSIVLPNASSENFYVQNFVSGNKSFVALIRKAEADKWISRINALGLNCFTLSLGIFPVQHMLSQLNEYGSEIILDGHQIKRDEQHNWETYRYQAGQQAPFPVKLAGEKIDEKLILPYAAAFQLMLSARLELIQADVPALARTLAQTLSKSKLKAAGVVALGIFFALLLINFVLFSYYDAAVNKLAQLVSQSVQSTTDLQSLNQQIKDQETKLQLIGWENNKGKAVMMDQIAQCLPSDVKWQQAGIDAPEITTGQTATTFENRTIRINGSSPQITAVNEWLARLRAKSWIRQAQLDSYNFNQEQNTGLFSLTIHY